MPKPSIIGLILTFNEEINIKDCITSLKCCDKVIVFDSFSNDQTIKIAKQCGAMVFQRAFDNYASQRNAALNHVQKKYDWILMIDADERLTTELSLEIIKTISIKSNTNTLYRVRRKDQFMNKWIKKSSGYPTWFPRLFKNGKVTVKRDINEEYTTNGDISNLQNHLIHYPFNKGLNWWFERHNKYSSLEAEVLTKEFQKQIPWSLSYSKDPVERRKFQKQLLYRIPGRPLVIFFMLYVLRRGFMDGVAGYRYCKMRMIYEMMIDLKIKELKTSYRL
jgi:glycosyltransferase involved in cell wall biosynthesis